MLRIAAVAVVLSTTGCTLNPFGGDDTGDDCTPVYAQGDGNTDLAAPLPQLLNPETLRCESFGGGCNPACGPCPPYEPVPTWAYCYGECDGLDEWTCRDATACRATYDYNCYTGEGECTALVAFTGCHGTDMSGPIVGSCAGLDAFACSQHNDCIALHTPQCSGDPNDCWSQFVECRDDATCYGIVLCDGLPPPCVDGSVPAVKNGCYTGECIPIGQCEPPTPMPV